MQGRRRLLKLLAAGAAGAFSSLVAPARAVAAAQPAGKQALHPAQAFDYAWLKGRARALAAEPYAEPGAHLPEALQHLDWDQYQAIRSQPEHALWARDPLRFRVSFFHLGLYYKTPVRMHVVDGGMAQELAYDPALFEYGKSGLAGVSLPRDLGFAGFRVNFRTDWKRDVCAFLGASYFRAVGGQWQYGQSARGLAIDCGMDTPEEFPRFSEYWLERPAPQSNTLVVYGLLESPSVTGAYRFALTPARSAQDNLVMEVDAALYPRRLIERLGVAPLTSMYQYGENDRRAANDWRPEIHDTDGLALWTGGGEWLWRPLQNPAQLNFNAFADDNPHGYGLLQRDRAFDHYQDDGVFYDRRPSVWVQPKGDWGKGAVQLVELPTPDETSDNIVAFWNPAGKPKGGEELLFGYFLHWGERMPFNPPLARTVATRTGIGGVVGRKRDYFSWRFVVDFAGGKLAGLPAEAKVEPVITVSRGEVEITSARPLESISGYRAMFDLRPLDESTAPVDLRMYLRLGNEALTETWIYQWLPPPASQRVF
jgi:glucans biosynthesis protein